MEISEPCQTDIQSVGEAKGFVALFCSVSFLMESTWQLHLIPIHLLKIKAFPDASSSAYYCTVKVSMKEIGALHESNLRNEVQSETHQFICNVKCEMFDKCLDV